MQLGRIKGEELRRENYCVRIHVLALESVLKNIENIAGKM